MRYALIISLLVLLVLVGLLADRKPDNALELYPLASAVGWVEGQGRSLDTDLIGVGIRPTGVVQIGSSYVPRVSPPVMLHYGAVVRAYRSAIGRPLDGADIPRLSWWINFLGTAPWALLLFAALRRLATIIGVTDDRKAIVAAWAAMAGSLAFGWLGVVSPWLPAASLAAWTVVLVLKNMENPKFTGLMLAGFLAGLAGAGHPSGWVWIVWGAFLMFVSAPSDPEKSRQTQMLSAYVIGAAISLVILFAGNFLFYGSPLPVQFIDTQPIIMPVPVFISVIWHDLIGWNGIIWLSPLVIVGLYKISGFTPALPGRQVTIFLLGLAALVLLVWGITEDVRLISENERIPTEFMVLPVELASGKISMVQLGGTEGGFEEQRAYYERLVARTDIFLWTGGRPVGLPVFLPVAVLLALFGWCSLSLSRIQAFWNWTGVRFGGLIGLVMSQAPYGAISDYYMYFGLILDRNQVPVTGHVPVIEALLSVAVRLAELWPSDVVTF